MNTTSIIIASQNKLVNKPYDLSHDLQHHYRVSEFALKIIEIEKIDCNPDIVIISSWLHDLNNRTGEDDVNMLILLKKHKINEEHIKIILSSIKHHSFNHKQSNIYEKILYDADKIEYVNRFRLNWFIQTYLDGYLKQRVYSQYVKEWFSRIDHIYNTLHFNFSKKTFLEMLPEAREIMEKARKLL